MTFNKFLIAMLIVFIGFTTFMVIRGEERREACKQKGGTVISTPQGQMCAKIERV